MKNYYLPEGTKYLTNNGLKCITELTEDDEILVIDQFGKVNYTKNFEVLSGYFDTVTLKTDNNFQGLMSNIELDFSDYFNCIERKEVNQITVEVDGEKYNKQLDKNLVIALALYISNFFKKNDKGLLISDKNYKQKTFKVLSRANVLSGIYFGYDRLSKNYSFRSNSFYKEIDNLCMILQENIGILNEVIDSLKVLSYSYYKGFYNVDFRNYKLAETFSTLISLLGYKSRVKFDSNLKTFKVTYTNNEHQLNYDWRTETNTMELSEPILCYSLRLNKNYKIVVSQNNNKLTTTSIIQASYNILEGDE